MRQRCKWYRSKKVNNSLKICDSISAKSDFKLCKSSNVPKKSARLRKDGFSRVDCLTVKWSDWWQSEWESEKVDFPPNCSVTSVWRDRMTGSHTGAEKKESHFKLICSIPFVLDFFFSRFFTKIRALLLDDICPTRESVSTVTDRPSFPIAELKTTGWTWLVPPGSFLSWVSSQYFYAGRM